MEKFAGYGFNKSHAAAYALIAYQTAYFKAHHPAAFMAANLSLVMDDTDKVRALYDDARRATASPSFRRTSTRPTIASSPSIAERIRYGLGGIKGTGEQAIEAIVAAREAGGPFRDLFDFCRRIDKRHVNRRAVEALIKSRRVRRDRAAPRDALRVGRHRAERSGEGRASRRAGVAVRRCAARKRAHTLVAAREWTEAERLAHEKAALGFYLSGHPYAAFAPELAPLIRQPLAELQPRNGTGADRRHRHVGARAVVAARQDGDRHARRRRRPRSSRRLQRDLRCGAQRCCAKTSSSSSRPRSCSAMTDDGQAQGLRDHRRRRSRPRGDPQALCQGPAPRVQRRRRSRASRRAADAVPQRQLSDRRRVPQPRRRRRARAARRRGA